MGLTIMWAYDPNHSAVSWENRHLGVAFIRGRFRQAEVTLDINDADLTRSSVVAIIDPNSIDSGNERRDDTLRGDVYLDVARYPTIEFHSRRIEKRGQGYAIVGDFTLHGTTHEVTLDAAFNGQVVNQRGVTVRGFSASTVIRRSDYGVSTTLIEGVFMAGDEIRVLIELEAALRED